MMNHHPYTLSRYSVASLITGQVGHFWKADPGQFSKAPKLNTWVEHDVLDFRNHQVAVFGFFWQVSCEVLISLVREEAKEDIHIHVSSCHFSPLHVSTTKLSPDAAIAALITPESNLATSVFRNSPSNSVIGSSR
jgi:hypothetical protein